MGVLYEQLCSWENLRLAHRAGSPLAQSGSREIRFALRSADWHVPTT